jgi:site-specific recombinase XerD
MAYLISPNNRVLCNLSLERYYGIPFLVSHNWKYLDSESTFIRQKAVGDWTSGSGKPSGYAIKTRLSENTVRSYSEDLKNFVSYCERRRINVTDLTYQDLLETYDRDMGTGTWSAAENPLAPETINRRMRIACEFLSWTAEKGIRAEFLIPTKTVRRTYGGSDNRRSQEIAQRIGQRRVDSLRLRLPSRLEISAFIEEVRVRHGRARGAAVEFAFASGCRLEEIVLLRTDQVPDPDTVDLDKPGRIDITYGAKGGRRAGDLSKAGKMRTARIARADLVKLHNYKQLARKRAIAQFRRLNAGKADPVELFLDERTGSPLSRQALYRAWRRTKTRPVEGKGVHTARHCFACYLILDVLEAEAAIVKLTLEQFPQSMLRSRVEDLIATHVRPVLGHVSSETTERYLDWLIDEIWIAPVRTAYSLKLDSLQ